MSVWYRWISISLRWWALIFAVHHFGRAPLWCLNNTTTPKCILILYSTPLNQFKVAYTSRGSIHLFSNPCLILKRDAFYIGRQYNDNYIMVAALWSSKRLPWPQWLVKLWLRGSAGRQRWWSWQLHCSLKNFFMCSWCCPWCDLAFLSSSLRMIKSCPLGVQSGS